MQPRIFLSTKGGQVRRRPPIVSAEQPICGVCKVQFSRYTCPHCNLHYCCLTCFRSPLHSSCSESFDRKSLIEEIQSSKDKTGQEKLAMMQLLKKFEDENNAAEDEDGSGDESEDATKDEMEEEERLGLEEQLQNLDLNTMNSDDLLRLLSPAQIQAFQETLSDSKKATALVDASYEEDSPWWTNDGTLNDSDGQDGAPEEKTSWRKRTEPSLVRGDELPLLTKDSDGKILANRNLVFNIVSVIFAYAHILRLFSLTSFEALDKKSSERLAALSLLSRLVPLLVEKSSDAFTGPEEAVAYVVSKIQDEDRKIMSPKHLALLLHDTATLMRPKSINILRAVTDKSSGESFIASEDCRSQLARLPLQENANVMALAALSDVCHLYKTKFQDNSTKTKRPSLINRPSSNRLIASTPASSGAAASLKSSKSYPQHSKQTKLALHKLLFYIAFLSCEALSVSKQSMKSIANSLDGEAEKRLREEDEIRLRIAQHSRTQNANTISAPSLIMPLKEPSSLDRHDTPRIEEL